MENIYIEKEVKVLDIFPERIVKRLEKLGAKKVFDADRIFTTLDYSGKRLSKENKEVRLTEEGKLKLSWEAKISENSKETIKLFVSRKQETLDFLNRLGLVPVAIVKSHRTSFEWEDIDFDIDTFPKIPPFLEIDLGDSEKSLEEIVNLLELRAKKTLKASTKEVYKQYGIDYYKEFKV